MIVYGVVLLQVFESATEIYVAYENDAQGWGSPTAGVTVVSVILDNLQPLLIAISTQSLKKRSLSSLC
jgi:hypothetical protein